MGALAVWLGLLAYFLFFVRWGFQVEDEGAQVYHVMRAAGGERPYLDFFTPYTPGFYWIRSVVWRASGGSLVALRMVMALVNATSATLLFVLARRVAQAPVAIAAVLLWVGLLPIDPGTFASFNVPYAGWFAVLAWAACAAVLMRWSDRGGAGMLVGAGLAVAAAFAMKPNAGVYALAAANWVVAFHARRDDRAARLVMTVIGVVMAVGIVMALRLAWGTREALLYLGPAVLAGVSAYGVGFGRLARPGVAARLSDLAVLWVSAGVASAVWMLPFLVRLGPRRFAHDVLFVGSDLDRVYWLPYPHLDASTFAVVLAACILVAIGQRRVRALPPWVWAVLAVAGGACAVVVFRRAPMPEGLAAAVHGQLLRVVFVTVPLVLFGATVTIAAACRSGALAGRWRELAVLAALASGMFLQMHPRADFPHLALAMPLAVVVGAGVVQALLDRVLAAAPARGRAAAFAVFALVVATIALVNGAVLASVARCQWEGTYVELPRFRVCVEPASGDDFVAFAETAWWLADHSAEGEAVLTFPSLGAVLVATGRTSPTYHDFWFVGDPTRDAERAMVARLVATPPRLAVTFNDTPGFFLDAPAYYASLRAFVTEHYRLVARFGRYDVLGLRSVFPGTAVAGGHRAVGPLAAAAATWPSQRRQAIARWSNALTPADTEHAALPADPIAARLVLRAIVENGDLRAAGWILAAWASPLPRLHDDARWAMVMTARRFTAARCRWAADLDVEALARYLAPHRDALDVLARTDDPWIAEFIAVIRTVQRGDDVSCLASGFDVEKRKGQVLLDLIAPQ